MCNLFLSEQLPLKAILWNLANQDVGFEMHVEGNLKGMMKSSTYCLDCVNLLHLYATIASSEQYDADLWLGHLNEQQMKVGVSQKIIHSRCNYHAFTLHTVIIIH